MKIFTLTERNQVNKWKEQRWMVVGGDGTVGGQLYAKVALIPVRSLNTVGGIRADRNYSRRKTRKGSPAGRVVTTMMLVAVATEIAKRRAKNKVAAESRRINRAR